MDEELPKIIGKVKIVVCTKCKTVQDWNEILEKGKCDAESLTKGWNRCKNKEFWEIE